MIVSGRSQWLKAALLFVAVLVCPIGLGVAVGWASTARPIGAYVTHCVADHGYQCDYPGPPAPACTRAGYQERDGRTDTWCGYG